VIASAVALVVVAFLVVYSMARQRASREATRRSEARRVRNRPQSAQRPKARVPLGSSRRSNLLLAFLLLFGL